MPMPDIPYGALVRVPIFGSHPVTEAELPNVQHAIAWGLRVDGSASYTLDLLHFDPNGVKLSMDPDTMPTLELFSAEFEHATMPTDGDPSIPDEVCRRMAVRALLPAELGETN